MGLSGGMSMPEIRGMNAPESLEFRVQSSVSSGPYPVPNSGLETLTSALPLLLLVLGVRADDPHDAFAADDLAVLTDPPDAATYFHRCSPLKPVADRRIRLYSR